MQRTLQTRRGTITFPAFIPVTTNGRKYPLDRLIRPYLPRLAQAAMVSYLHAQALEGECALPLWIDSGGFAALFDGARVVGRKSGDTPGHIEISGDGTRELVDPKEVLDFQERTADAAFTLDFPIPAGAGAREANRRMELTLRNAAWALDNRRRRDLPLFACLQGTDVESYRRAARALATHKGFAGFAVGGLVPKLHDRKLVRAIVEAVRAEIGDSPLLHVFGVGHPERVREMFDAGADSTDSSSYVKLAAEGKLWSHPELKITDPAPTTRLHLALCNLALVTQAALPLSASRIVFSTYAIDQHTGEQERHDDHRPKLT